VHLVPFANCIAESIEGGYLQDFCPDPEAAFATLKELSLPAAIRKALEKVDAALAKADN
jgi:hypothetical protein